MGETTAVVGRPTTFLFTDIEGSTRLLQELGSGYGAVLAEHHRILQAAIADEGGEIFGTEGDSFRASFADPASALRATLTAQRGLASCAWPTGVTIRVRMGLHVGDASFDPATSWIGLAVHKAARVSAAAHGGQVLVSDDLCAAVADACASDDVSFRDLGEHRLKDFSAPVRIFQVCAHGLDGDFPPPRSQGSASHNLPNPTTSFVGREDERAEVFGLLDTTRLLTLTGTGGAGKTRLALRVAADVLDRYPGGVWFADLAAIDDAAQILGVVASATRTIDDGTADLVDAIASRLDGRDTLIVLDNCEHLIAGCADAARRILDACPGVSILATSREPLAITGEATWRLPSLDVDYENSEAVQLFAERAATVDPSFVLQADNVATVADICRRLDGIPLAIELAAARTRVLTVDQLSERLDQRLRLLTADSRDVSPRQKTLAATVDWSYDLLEHDERRVFRRLAVFSGTFPLQGAEHVCTDEAVDTVDVLSRLVAKSMVVPEDGRYRLLETLRQYAYDVLVETGELSGAKDRLVAWVLEMARSANEGLFSSDDVYYRRKAIAETTHIRSAMAWSFETDRPDDALEIAAAFWMGWVGTPMQVEGLTWLERALVATDRTPTPIRARALVGALLLRHNLSRPGEEIFDEARACCEALPPCVERARFLPWVISGGIFEWAVKGDFDASRREGLAAIDVARELGDDYGIGLSLAQYGRLLAITGDIAAGKPFTEEALAMARPTGAKLGLARVIGYHMAAYLDGSDDDLLESLAREALELARETEDSSMIAGSLQKLSWVAGRRGDLDRACALGDETLAALRDIGKGRTVTVEGLRVGQLYLRRGDADTARMLFMEALSNAISDDDVQSCHEQLARLDAAS